MEEKGTTAPKGFYHFMVKRFLRKNKELTSRVWAREIKIAKKLFNLRPNVDFWNRVDLGFSLNSLAWLLSSEGKHSLFVQGKVSALKLKKPETYKLTKKIGKDRKILEKKKTLMEILDEPKKN